MDKNLELDEYQKFKQKKRKRKEIEKKISENWVLGKEKELIESVVPRNTANSKKKKSSQHNIKKKKKKISVDFMQKNIIGHSKDSSNNNNNGNVDNEKRVKKKKKSISTDSIISNNNGNIKELEIRPLEDWLLNYSSSNAKKLSDIKNEVVNTMHSIIENKEKDPANNVCNSTNVVKSKSGTFKKPSRRSQKQQSSEENKKKEECEEMKEFFKNDTNGEEFLMPSPSDYKIFKDLEQKHKEMEIVFEDGGKSSIMQHKDEMELKLEDIEECSMVYCRDFLREPRGIKFGERKCRDGENCIFNIMAIRYPDSIDDTKTEDGFICREFLFPSQIEKWKKESKLPDEQQLCLGCNRQRTTFWYYDYRRKGVEPFEILQDHWNPINDDKNDNNKTEYPSQCCIYPNSTEKNFDGIVRPFVKFCRSNYIYAKVELINDVTGRKIELKAVKETILQYFR